MKKEDGKSGRRRERANCREHQRAEGERESSRPISTKIEMGRERRRNHMMRATAQTMQREEDVAGKKKSVAWCFQYLLHHNQRQSPHDSLPQLIHYTALFAERAVIMSIKLLYSVLKVLLLCTASN